MARRVLEASLTAMDAADPINFTKTPVGQFSEKAASVTVSAAKYRALKDNDAARARVFNLLAPASKLAVTKVLDAIGKRP